MDATERAKEIADRFEDGLSRDAVRDLASDIADAIRAAESAVRERCAKIAEEFDDGTDANVPGSLYGPIIADRIREGAPRE